MNSEPRSQTWGSELPAFLAHKALKYFQTPGLLSLSPFSLVSLSLFYVHVCVCMCL